MRAKLLFTCALALCPVAAQTTKTLDLSTKHARKTFYVIFAARGGSATGHAFVLWGSEDSVHQRSTIRAYGLYPENEKDACSSAIRRVSGAVVDESTNHGIANITDELIVKVDESDFKSEFSLLGSDCVEFLRAVGDSLSLEMPQRTLTRWTPRAYVRALLASVNSAEEVGKSGSREVKKSRSQEVKKPRSQSPDRAGCFPPHAPKGTPAAFPPS